MSGNREPVLFKALKKSEETGGYTKFRSLHSGYTSSPNPTVANETATRITDSGTLKPPIVSQPLRAARARMAAMGTPAPTITNRKKSLLDVSRKSLMGNTTGILINTTRPTTPNVIDSLVPVSSTAATPKVISRDVRLVLAPAVYFASPSITATSPQQQQQQQQKQQLEQTATVSTWNSSKMSKCIHCGTSSAKLLVCERCRLELDERKLSDAGVSAAKRNVPTLPVNFYGNKSITTAGSRPALPPFRDRSPISLQRSTDRPKQIKTRLVTAKSAAPVVLTLSSDEEGQDADQDENSNENGMEIDDDDDDDDGIGHDDSVTIATGSSADGPALALPLSGAGDFRIENGSPLQPTNSSPVTIHCRLRIGSYKVAPKEPLIIDSKSIRLKVPTVSDDEEVVALTIRIDEVSKMLVHLGRDLPSIFVDTKPTCAANVRSSLKMDGRSGGPYYDPESHDDLVKRLIILPEELAEDQRDQLTRLFAEIVAQRSSPSSDQFIEKISKFMVNQLLLGSSPPEAKIDLLRLTKKNTPALKTPKQKVVRVTVIRQSLRLQKQSSECVTLATYPLPPTVGGISVTTEDMRCLEPGEFLNDVIIDFYLKYLFGEILSEEDRNRTHIFSSFFFKRITNSDMPSENDVSKDPVKSSANKALSMAETRHSRVKNWTRNVNIFEKDFVVIPINENSHWFLVVICFAHLVGLVGDEESCPPPSAEHDYESDILEDPLFKDELNGRAIKEADSQSRSTQTTINDEHGISRRPCILIFDSLRTHSTWSHVFRLLREYLAMEYQHKMHGKREFSRETICAGYPNVPQQTNYSDCGIFVLQYVESFFKNPIKNFQTPIRGIDNWFSSEMVCKTKRKEIEELILRLHKDQKGKS